MGAAIGDVLGLAAGVAVSPLPIVAIILILGTAVLLLASPAGASEGGEPAAWTGWVELLLGVGARWRAARLGRGRPAPGAEPEMPRWMAGLDRIGPGGAFGLGALLSAANPKNGRLTIAAAASIAGAGLPGTGQAVALAVFVLIGSAGVLAPLVLCLAAGERAANTLELEDMGGHAQCGDNDRPVPGLRLQARRRRHRRPVLKGEAA